MNDIVQLSKEFTDLLKELPAYERSYILFGLLIDNQSNNDIAKTLALLNILFVGVETIHSNKNNELVYAETLETLENFQKFSKKLLDSPSTKTLIENFAQMTKYEQTH